MQKIVAIAILAASVVTSSAWARAETCRSTSEREIAGLFDRWNNSLQTGEPRKVVANYAEKSVLLPAVSDKIRLTPAEKEDYFHHFMEKKPVGRIDSRTLAIDCNTAMDNGVYIFTFQDGSQVKARYTYTYKWDPKKKKWLITSHHSSVMPEKTSNVPTAANDTKH